MNKKGLLIVLSGPSGSGKGTVLKELFKTQENICVSVSATTRKPRPGEEDGVHYHFIDKDKFKALIDNDGMLEYAEYCENYYGTPKQMVLDKCAQGVDVVLEIEVQGAMQIKEKCPEAVLIFIAPPSIEILKKRLTDRQTEDEETINKRMNTALKEMEYSSKYDYIVVNDELDKAVEDLKEVLLKAKAKQ